MPFKPAFFCSLLGLLILCGCSVDSSGRWVPDEETRSAVRGIRPEQVESITITHYLLSGYKIKKHIGEESEGGVISSIVIRDRKTIEDFLACLRRATYKHYDAPTESAMPEPKFEIRFKPDRSGEKDIRACYYRGRRPESDYDRIITAIAQRVSY